MSVPERPAPHAAVGGDLAAGTLLARRYLLVRPIGEGGMAAVWEGRNTWTDRRVAVKVLARPADAGAGATLGADEIDRFAREARATARIRHPNVVDVLDMGQDAERGVTFIVYDLLDGGTLRAFLAERGRVDPAEAARLLLPVMEGVAAAHRAGVLHRDLKPENVVLAREPDGRTVPRVIDFGIARLDDPEETGLTRAGAVLGTACAMSPEQARGARDLDARTDVWALGVMWFEALTGAAPFAGGGYNEVLARVLTTAAPPLASVLPGASPALAAAVDRSLARDLDARHPSVDDALAAFRACPELGDPARPTAPPARRAPPLRPRIALAAAALVGAALAVAALAIPALRRRPPTAVGAPAEPDRAPPVTAVMPAPTPRAVAETGPAAVRTVAPRRPVRAVAPARHSPAARDAGAGSPAAVANGAPVLEP